MRLLLAAFLAALPLAAQSIVTARAGMIYAVEGPVTIDGEPVHIVAKAVAPQVKPGEVLGTTRSHAEMLLGQDAFLWSGNDTQIRLDDSTVDAPRIALLAGSAILEIKHTRAERHVFVDFGNQTAEIVSAGIYRFDRTPGRVRVWSGALTLQGPPGVLVAGQSAEQGRRDTFNKRGMDELHFFAAFRSIVLESESGRFEAWKQRPGDLQWAGGESRPSVARAPRIYKHSGFDIEMPLPAAAARSRYMVASEAGLVNYMEGSVGRANRRASLPFRIGPTAIETNNARIEVFLGLGITARLNDHSRLRVLETSGITPVVALESGEVLIEVAKSADNTFLSVRLGDTMTDLHKPGVYRFQETSSSLFIYGGESATRFGGEIVRATRGQRVDLTSRHINSFDANHQDEFFQWSGRRSLQLFGSAYGFMTDWEPTLQPSHVRHKQYGDSSKPMPRITPAPQPRPVPSGPGTITP